MVLYDPRSNLVVEEERWIATYRGHVDGGAAEEALLRIVNTCSVSTVSRSVLIRVYLYRAVPTAGTLMVATLPL